MLLGLPCAGLLGPPRGPLPATSRLRRPRPVCQIQFCASLHLLAGMALLLLGHQVPLYGLDLQVSVIALVVDDGSTQLARISLPRTTYPWLDQLVTTSFRRDPVVDCLSLLLQWQRLEILWHRWSLRGRCCTRGTILATPKPRVPLPPRHFRCVAQRENGVSALMFSRGNRIQRWRKHGNCVSSQMIVKERKYVAVMSVGLPGVVLWHIACPNSVVPSRDIASHPFVARYHQSSLRSLSQESDSRPSAVSEVLAKRLFVVHWVEWCSSGDTVYSHPYSFCCPGSLALHHRFFFSCPSVPCRGSVSVLSVFGARWSDVEAIHECILFCSDLSHVAQCIAHSSEVVRGWISAGILCPGPKPVKGRSKCGDCSLVTTARTLSFSKNRCPRPRSMWQPRSLKKILRQQEWRSTRHHIHAQYSIDSCDSNRLKTQSPGFQCLIVAKTESHGLRKLDPLCGQTPSSCEHPFPLLKSTLSDQETRASCVNHTLANVI